jgi:hypothetical protein
MEVNVNDAFEQILLSEERIAEESYKQGFEKGVSEGNLEAYHLGKKKLIRKQFSQSEVEYATTSFQNNPRQKLIFSSPFQAFIEVQRLVLSSDSTLAFLRIIKFHLQLTKKFHT